MDGGPRQYPAPRAGRRVRQTSLGRSCRVRRRDIDLVRGRIRVTSTAIELRGRLTLENEPRRHARSVRARRSLVMRRLELNLSKTSRTLRPRGHHDPDKAVPKSMEGDVVQPSA